MKHKETKLIIFTILLTIVAFGIAFSYAYFSLTIFGNETASSLNTNSANLEINFDTTDYIYNTTADLIDDSEKEEKADVNIFSVSHTPNSTVSAAAYVLTLDQINISQNLKSEDFKWELLKYDELLEDGSVINSGDFSSVNSSMTLVDTPQILPAGQIDHYIFRIWLSKTNQDQSKLYGSFSGKIVLTASSPANSGEH